MSGNSEQKVIQGSTVKMVEVRGLTKGELNLIVSLANANRTSLVFGASVKDTTRSGKRFVGYERLSRIFYASTRSEVGRASIEVPPSSYLYRLGRLLDKSTREMVFTPLIADFHHEYFDALAHGQPTRRLVWVYWFHGTIALFRALWLGLRKQLVSGGG